MLQPVLVTPPATTCLTLADAKAQCRIDSSDEDMKLLMLIDAATAHADGYRGILGRALIEQTWRQDFAGFCSPLRLPLGDLIAVTAVEYYDAANTRQSLDASLWQGLSDARGPYVAPAAGVVWPATYARPDAVSVTWTAGFGPAAGDVPAAIRQALLMLIGHWHANREAVTIGNAAADLPFAVDALLAPFRRAVL